MSGDTRARRHWFIIMGVRLIGVAGALFGVVLASRGVAWPHKGTSMVGVNQRKS